MSRSRPSSDRPGRTHPEHAPVSDPRPGPWAIAALAVVAVAGVGVLGAMLTTEFERDAETARSAARAATLATTLIDATTHIQTERGLSELRWQVDDASTSYGGEYRATRRSTDREVERAMAALTEWAEADAAAPPPRDLPADLLRARARSDEGGGDAFELYSAIMM